MMGISDKRRMPIFFMVYKFIFSSIRGGLERVGSKWLDTLLQILWDWWRRDGLYEALSHDATLELLDAQGHRAIIRKLQTVRYLQDNIIAYQDQAWGDGKILLDYQCEPGFAVDRYTIGQRTHLLISLRGSRKRGDTDTFQISWEVHDGFPFGKEQWTTTISHHTQMLRSHVIFPAERRPIKVWTQQQQSQRQVQQDSIERLLDGRWKVCWEVKRPKRHDSYIIKWIW